MAVGFANGTAGGESVIGYARCAVATADETADGKHSQQRLSVIRA